MKKQLIIIFTLLATLPLWAEEVSFTASAPRQVVAGQPFQLTYTINQRYKDFRTPDFNGFEVLAGPYSSQSSSTQWINGKRTSSFTITQTYTLMADQTGEYAIQPASIVVDKQKYTSNGLKITVLPPDSQPQSSSQSHNSQSGNQTRQESHDINLSSDNIFVRTIVNKTKVYEQECIALSYKLYFAGVDVMQITNNTQIPEFKGFLKQEVDLGELQTELEHYNGRNYKTCILYKTLLFPQQSGELRIDPASFEAVIRVRNQTQVRSIFDNFFDSYTNVNKTIKAPALKFQVSPLPAGKPADFSGGVGRFRLTSSISTDELQINEAVTIKIDISGTGNLKMLKTPAVDWPDGFEVYDPKVSNNFKTNQNDVSGTKSIEYLAIPRTSGNYTIPAITLSYFDIDSKQYKTLRTPEYTLQVAKNGNEPETVVNTFVSKEDIRQLGTDIRYIHTDTLPRPKTELIAYGSWQHWLCYIAPFILSVALFIGFRRRIKENADIRKVRYKKASKVAQRRLKRAKALLKDGKKEAFYEEIERAAWSYLSDRLSIPTADLNKENIAQLLREKDVDEPLIQKVNDVLSTAEFARYAPAQSEHQMEDLYNETVALIENLTV